MDAVLDGVAETHALLERPARAPPRASNRPGTSRICCCAQLASHGATDRGRQGGNPVHLIAIAEELRRKVGSLASNIGSAIDQMDRELRQLRDAAERLRLVSADSLFTALERTARDSARALSKQVVFEGTGGDIRLDAHVLGLVQGALIQIVRNAVAHGIELEGERLAAGKPAAGRVAVGVSRRGRRIVFECRDDGRGVDLEAVRRVAVQRGAGRVHRRKSFSADDLPSACCCAAASARPQTVTDMSGRGIGLDVVREAVERLGGEVDCRASIPGAARASSSSFRRRSPSMEALIVEADGVGSATAIPLDGVRRTLRLAASDISCAASGASILFEDKAIAFRSAGDGARRQACLGAPELDRDHRRRSRRHRGHRRRAPAGHRDGSSSARCPTV